jgi:hypothetical protein
VKAAVPRPDSLVWEDPPECKTPETPASVLTRLPESPQDGISSPEPEPASPNPVELPRARYSEPTPWEVNSWEEKRLQRPGQDSPPANKSPEIPPLSSIGAETVKIPEAEERKEEQSEGAKSPERRVHTPESVPPPGSVKCPPWLARLRQWLPGYLSTKRGVQYAMSSLKGDFRACFGLEIPHHELGFVKLSDFLRSMPDVVKMKIVPTGTGASTHVVLMPRSPRALAPGRPPTAPKPPTKFVSSGRSYASAAQGQPKKGESETGPEGGKKDEEQESDSQSVQSEEANEAVDDEDETEERALSEQQFEEQAQQQEQAQADNKARDIAMTPTGSPATKAIPSTPDLSEGPPDSILKPAGVPNIPFPRTPTPTNIASEPHSDGGLAPDSGPSGSPFHRLPQMDAHRSSEANSHRLSGADSHRLSGADSHCIPPGFGFRKEDREFYLGRPSLEPPFPPEATARQLFNSPRSPHEMDRELFEHEMMLQRMAHHPGLATGRRSPLPLSPGDPMSASRGPGTFTPGPSPLRPGHFDHLLFHQPSHSGASPGDRFRGARAAASFDPPQNAFDFRSMTPDGRAHGGHLPGMGAILQSRLGAIGGGISPGRGLVEGMGGVVPKYCEAEMHPYQQDKAREWTPFGARESPTSRSSFLSWMDWEVSNCLIFFVVRCCSDLLDALNIGFHIHRGCKIGG